jgi:voltage-gated potassium channel
MSKKSRNELHDAFFEHHTPTGKVFDIFFFIMIIGSIGTIMMDSVPSLHAKYKVPFHTAEWVFTILFTIEYVLRLSLSGKPSKFVLSFFGIVDLNAIQPTYFSHLLPGVQAALILRSLRLLRIFRIFRLSIFLKELKFLSNALSSSLRKISIFFMFAFVIIIIMSSLMYLVEDPKNGFVSIPECIYWAIATITTVGYGDLVPTTPMGKIVANALMLIGYAIIAVPTSIITTEMALAVKSKDANLDTCKKCGKKGHDYDAAFCKYCGAKFETHA